MRTANLVVFASLLALGALALPSNAQETGPVHVDTTVAIVSFGNYDAKQGTYVLDFYLVLQWDSRTAPPNFTADAFEFANGRATSQDLQLDETDPVTGTRSLWYRVQANLYSEPKYNAYPFDQQTVEVRLEDTLHPENELVYVANTTASVLQDGFNAAGWQIKGTEFNVTRNDYSFDEPYSQARFVITLQRSVLSGVLKIILPPLAFITISAVSFFLVGADKIATRFGLAANMAISGVVFHGAQTANLPSLSRLIFLDRYMLAVDVFLFGSLAVAALVALADFKWKKMELTKRINLRGAILVPIVAVAAFLLLLFA